jgi:truncated hemoglobin YjbI
MNKDIVHAKNERLYAIVKKDSILKQVFHADVGERKKKPM